MDIAGNGDHRAALEALARRLDLGSAAVFHGFVTEAEKMRLFRAAWANVFPSPKEGWGITVVEAGACGTPSLASDSPGLRDSVRNGETGFLVPHGDAEALAAVIKSERPVLGIGEGGYAFFGKLGLNIGWGNGIHGDGTSILAGTTLDSIWKEPYPITIPKDQILGLYGNGMPGERI